MFIWKDESPNVGILHLDTFGDITGHKALPRERAKSLYNHLKDQGAKVSKNSEGVDRLPDYKRSIDWLLRRI